MVRAGLVLAFPYGRSIPAMIFGGPGLRSSQSPGGALDRQRGRRSRAGASLLRPQRLGDRFCPPISAFYSLEISTSSTSSRVRPLLRQSTRARAVSMAVRQGMLSSTVLRRSFTLSSLGLRPLALVLMT